MKDCMDFLMRDPVLHADMIYMYKFIPGAEVLYSEDDGVLVASRADGTYLMSAESEEAVEKMLRFIDVPVFDLFLHQLRFAGPVIEKKQDLRTIPCWQYVYAKNEMPAIRNVPGIVIKPLNMTYLSFIRENYKAGEDAYVWALENGMLGAFDHDRCVGFMGTRCCGELGLLNVLPDYRGRGIAKALESRIMAERLKEGKPCYSNIVIGNEASIKLHESLGFEKADSLTVWLISE